MNILLSLLLLLAFSAISTAPTIISAVPPPQKKMRAFKSEQELKKYFQELAGRRSRLMRYQTSDNSVNAAKSTIGDFGLVGAVDASSITNTQHAGVDEGGIVKVHGNHLVILRRGRLFTVELGDSSLTPVSALDAFGPEIDPQNAWYDELLISEDTIVVIGYSYERGGTELGFFNIDAHGQLNYLSTYHLRSNDYFSSRNYASRLIGKKLVFYTPLYMDYGDPAGSFPAVRKWHKGAKPGEFRRIADATRVYRPEMELDVEFGSAMHTVTTCDLSNGGFDCRASVVIGPRGNVFYVSTDSVYVWATSWGWDSDRSRSILFRMPLDGSAPSALRVSGGPVDQFSFLESADEHLNVLVRSESKGDAMWASETSSGDVALMRIALSSFSDGSETVPAKSYRRLPKPRGGGFQNRFVGNYLIYGTDFSSAAPASINAPQPVYFVEWANGVTHRMDLPHGADRIEQMGNGVVIIGPNEYDLIFTSIRLEKEPEAISRHTRPQASQGETRSHGFFYKPDGIDTGLLGLPISGPARRRHQTLLETSASILFLRNDSFKFKVVGELGSKDEKAVDDGCRASCVDWYGNARPIFLRGRVFALLGYELVEGKLDNGRIAELRRVNYAPR